MLRAIRCGICLNRRVYSHKAMIFLPMEGNAMDASTHAPMKATIQDIRGLDIATPQGIYHGADQDWYSSIWRRKGGCGPTTASNILRYMGERVSLPLPSDTKEAMQSLMEWVWDYVTPTMFGLNSTELFVQGMDKLLKERGSTLRCRVLDVPAEHRLRPSVQQTADFFREAFEADSPLAFLNLDRGELHNLETWHWVTLIGMEQEGKGLVATAADNGQMLRLDMGLWLKTTRRNGGFVYLR